MKKQPHKRPGLHQLPPAIDCGSGYSWLPFFLMALGAVGATASAQERVLSNYYWIRSQEEPVHATRVIKVLGEKGEKYNEVFSEAFPIQNHASIQQGRLARLRALRQDAMELARRFKEAGKTPEVAYEDAWTQVYTRNLLSANGGEGDNRLDSLLRQLAEGESDLELSDSDAQWLLEALIEDDSRLDSEEGRLLLSKLSERLRVNGSDLSLEKYSAQDELMHTFANSLLFCEDSMDAYRDALFKVNRGFIMNHPLVGYRAPWGLGLSRSKAVYLQAKNPTPSQTISSANTQAQTVPFENLHVGGDEKQTSENISAGLNPDAGKIENFLATSPLLPEEDEQDESKKELDEREETEETEKGATAAAPAPPLMMMLSARFSLRSAASPVADSGPELQSLTWAGSTGNDTWLVNGDSAATPWQGGAVYTDGSHVTFSSTSAVKDVQLDGTVRPGSITVSGTTPGTSNLKTLGYNYAFTGHGSIADYIGGATSISVNGSATLVLNTANTFRGGINMAAGTTLYLGCDDAAGTGAITMGTGAKLIVNYNSADPKYRAPSLGNALNLTGNTASVSFGTASYADNNKLPCEWRTVNLTGGVSGSGNLELCGYTYLSKSDDGTVVFNYVSNFAVNESGVEGTAGANRFDGTVYLKNEFNHFSLGSKNNNKYTHEISNDKVQEKTLAGAVQLTLQDDVFSNATLDLTREVSTDRYVGGKSNGKLGSINRSVSSDSILVLSNSSQITIKALEADFLNRGWDYLLSNGKPVSAYYGIEPGNGNNNGDYSQTIERWNVRVVTDGYTNLVLEDSSNTEHVFSGSMGFAHSYTNATQAYIDVNKPGNPGGGSLGVENLSLEKRGAASQYIHSAKLYNLSIAEGTLGFNNLSVSGRLLINAGSELRLGVTDVGTGTNAWENLSGVTITSLTVGSGQLEVRTSSASKQAKVDGDLVLGASADGSMLTFDIHGIMPSTEKISSTTILDVAGTLSLWDKTAVTINFSDINLSEHYNEDFTYYLASAGSINIQKSPSQDTGAQDASFNNQIISLGAGYYGKLSVVEPKGNDSKWYLALNVVGDPRRTWSGMVSEGEGFVWTTTSSRANKDYQWKEKEAYTDGLLTLFGNLYQPVKWVQSETLTSSETVHVREDKLHTGNPITENDSGFSIDGQSAAVEGFQKVEIVGTVRPAAIFIGSDYTLHSVTDGVVSTIGTNAHDDTNYYFYGTGKIDEAGDGVLHESFLGSSTSLRKMGYGTAVIATNNSFEGGTVLEGGRIVMQHYNALGTGEITIYNTTLADAEKQNIPILQGDFSDDRDAYGLAGQSSYVGEGMDTSTIHNTVNVLLQTGAQGGVDTERVDARIANAHDKKLVLRELKGDYGSVVSLYGHSASSGQYTYAVFKVLNPSEFYGTIVMDGNILGAEENDTGGKVQMEIMTTEKSAEGADWLNTVIDLSIRNGTERTVLALDALGGSGQDSQDALVDALTGGGYGGKRINSSVVNMSHDKAVILELEGQRGGDYDGVLGFGEFQKTLNYEEGSGYAADSAAATQVGYEAHHYGRAGSAGELSVRKKGKSVQSVNSAVLNTLEVQDGYFRVDEALVVSTLNSTDGSHILVGEVSTGHSHALVVGKNGILAIDSNAAIGSNAAVDAFAALGAGIPMSLKEVVKADGSTSIEVVDPSSFVLFADGATITAHGDWYTNCKHQASMTVGGTTYTSSPVPVSIDIATGASVTINTHNYTPDATINASNDVFRRYNSSHVIQLLGEMEGHDVHLTFNNELISAAAQEDGSAGSTGSMMGYAAIRDLHQFAGDSSVTVKARTTLQVNGTSASSAASADEPAPLYEEQLVVNVQGNQSAIQFTDDLFTNVQEYQVDKVTLENGGHVLIGGALKNTTSADERALDMSGVETAVTHRGAETASITNLNMKDSGTQVKLGGSANNDSVVINASISTKGTATNLNLEIHHAELHSSLVQLHAKCSLNLEETVLVDKDSAVQGAAVQNAAISAAELQGPLFPTEAGNEVSTSAATVVQLTLTNTGQTFTDVGTKNKVLVLQMNQFQGVNVTGSGLTLQLTEQSAHFLDWGYNAGAQYVAIQVGGGSGRFLFEEQDSGFASGIDTYYKLMGADGVQITGTWVTATTVGTNVSSHLLYFNVPEPATATLSLAALVALCARRRRR